jgi:hypothetical protein
LSEAKGPLLLRRNGMNPNSILLMGVDRVRSRLAGGVLCLYTLVGMLY